MSSSLKNGVAVLIGASFLLSACAENYTPVVDMKGVNPDKYQQDLEECRQYATQIDAGSQANGNSLKGIKSDASGFGSGKSTTLGSFGTNGTVSDPAQWQVRIIDNCLIGRGYRVLG